MRRLLWERRFTRGGLEGLFVFGAEHSDDAGSGDEGEEGAGYDEIMHGVSPGRVGLPALSTCLESQPLVGFVIPQTTVARNIRVTRGDLKVLRVKYAAGLSAG